MKKKQADPTMQIYPRILVLLARTIHSELQQFFLKIFKPPIFSLLFSFKNCKHFFCFSCLRKYILSVVKPNIPCPLGCSYELTDEIIQMSLDKREYEERNEKLFQFLISSERASQPNASQSQVIVLDSPDSIPDSVFMKPIAPQYSSASASSASASSASASSASASSASASSLGNESNKFECSVCHSKSDCFSLSCSHSVCLICLKKHIATHVSSDVGCPIKGCQNLLPDSIIRNSLTQQEYDEREEKLLQAFLNSNEDFCKCPKCGLQFERAESKEDTSKLTDADSKPLTPAAQESYKKYRIRCQCETIFCAKCNEIPFHLGYTCEQFKAYRSAKKCRFCDEQIKPGTPAQYGIHDVCSNPECVEKSKTSCTKILKCGHPCCGVRNEVSCLKCLHEGCIPEDEIDEYCNICWVEGLPAAPCVQLECKHIFHYHCLVKRLQEKWPTARITFGFCDCPLCKQPIKHPALNFLLDPIMKLKSELEAKATQRLQYEGLAKSKDLTNVSSPYYKQPTRYAMETFSYFQCFKCQQPYFAGMKRCDQGNDKEINRSELVCGGCSGKAATVCKKHGAEFLEWKCRFCCSVASWYCWNTTHFCEECHKKQNSGDHLTKKPASAFPKCKGASTCPLHVDHPHLTEFLLGCSMCRNLSDF
eukprot:TRINITY_DN2253_c0_g1_i2.p1 TRINITY_DN2253_c0_g1~~TRINITY_DN2253_c0_g1_i2.p1  ORF type:complete len:650 (+),score=112.13 TRINITY_DN2253_c0_g1_i2:497-2446(+)